MADQEPQPNLSFSVEDWMSAKPTPDGLYRAPGTAFVYGLRQTKSGIGAYWAEVKNDRTPDLGRVLSQHLLITTKGSAFVSAKAAELLAKHSALPVLGVGSICTHNDGQGTHPALILSVSNKNAQALFLTSRPGWNQHARCATAAETSMFMGRGTKRSYLAPVTRPLSEFFCHMGLLQYPDVRKYIAEFCFSF
jgi:hypothetical protein